MPTPCWRGGGDSRYHRHHRILLRTSKRCNSSVLDVFWRSAGQNRRRQNCDTFGRVIKVKKTSDGPQRNAENCYTNMSLSLSVIQFSAWFYYGVELSYVLVPAGRLFLPWPPSFLPDLSVLWYHNFQVFYLDFLPSRTYFTHLKLLMLSAQKVQAESNIDFYDTPRFFCCLHRFVGSTLKCTLKTGFTEI